MYIKGGTYTHVFIFDLRNDDIIKQLVMLSMDLLETCIYMNISNDQKESAQ